MLHTVAPCPSLISDSNLRFPHAAATTKEPVNSRSDSGTASTAQRRRPNTRNTAPKTAFACLVSCAWVMLLEHPHRATILDDRGAISDKWLAKQAHRAANSDDLFGSRLQKVVTARKMAPFCQPASQPAKQHATKRFSLFRCFSASFSLVFDLMV